MAERVGAGEVPEVPADEGEIEAVVVADEEWTALGVVLEPARELLHDYRGIVEGERLFARETRDRERLRDPLVGDRLELAVEGLVQARFHEHGAERDHAVVAGNRSVGFYIDHHVSHRRSSSMHRHPTQATRYRHELR